MTARWPWVLGTLLLGLLAGATHAETKTVERLRLHLPAQSLESMPLPAEPLVEVEPARLDQLIEQYEAASAEVSRREMQELEVRKHNPEFPMVIRRIDLTGTVGQTDARLEGIFTIDSLTSDPAQIALLGPGFAVESMRSSVAQDVLVGGPRPIESRPSDGGDSASSPGVTLASRGGGAGVHRVQLVVRVPVLASRAQRRLELVLPGAACQHMQLRIVGPASGLTLDAGGVGGRITEATGGALDVDAQVGSVTHVRLAWTDLSSTDRADTVTSHDHPQSGAPPRPAAPRRLICHASTIDALGDGLLRFQTHLDLTGVPAGTRAIVLSCDSAISIREISCASMDRWRPVTNRGATRAIVQFVGATSGTVAITCEGDLPLEGGTLDAASGARTQRVTLPCVGVEGAFRTEGILGACAAATDGLTLREAHSRALTPIDPAQVPAGVAKLAPNPILIAARYTDAHPVASVEVRRFDAQRTPDIFIESATGLTVIAPNLASDPGTPAGGLRTMTRMLLKVASLAPGHLQVSLPKGAQVVACFVDLTSTEPQLGAPGQDGQATYLVPIKRSPILDGRCVPYPVEVSYRLPLPMRLGAWGDIGIPLPRLGAPVGAVTWTMYAPEGVRTYAARGSLTTMEADRELYLVSWANALFELAVGRIALVLVLGSPFLGFLIWIVRRFSRRPAGGPPGVGQTRTAPAFMLMVIAGAVMLVLASIAVPNFKAARERANIRACYANQKTISGAIEMYNLDKNTRETDVGRLLPLLVSGGYLQSIPDDPGYGAGSYTHYESSPDSGFGVTCRVHGPIQ